MLHDIQINPADGSLWIADSRNNRVRAMADVANAPGAVIPTGGLTPPPPPPPGGCTSNCTPIPGKSGYWMLGEDGKVFAFGDAARHAVTPSAAFRPAPRPSTSSPPRRSVATGSTTTGAVSTPSATPATSAAITACVPAGRRAGRRASRPPRRVPGYWLFTSKGRVFTFGDAGKFGDLGHLTLNGADPELDPDPLGQGLLHGRLRRWRVRLRRRRLPGLHGRHQAEPAGDVPGARPATSHGYWLVASDGGIFAFGDARLPVARWVPPSSTSRWWAWSATAPAT